MPPANPTRPSVEAVATWLHGRFLRASAAPSIDEWKVLAADVLRFADRRVREELEEIRRETAIHSQYPVETDYDKGYAAGRKDAAAQIAARRERAGSDGDAASDAEAPPPRRRARRH